MVVVLSILVAFVFVRQNIDQDLSLKERSPESSAARSISLRRLGTKNTGDTSGYWDDVFIDQPYGSSSNRYLVVIHIVVIGYMFLGLNTVCDLYFTGALDEMVNKWKIKPDVAGATFMAAGGSAPELFTSLIGTCVLGNDVGFATIVGSAVFNVFFVIGLCGFTATTPIHLTRWPLARDCTYYIFGLSVLALFAKTGNSIEWWEAILLFLGYIGYCTIMYFNPQLEEYWNDRTQKSKDSEAVESPSQTVVAAPVANTGSTADEAPVSDMTPVTPVADTGSTADNKHHIKKSQPHFERKAGGSKLASVYPVQGDVEAQKLDEHEEAEKEASTGEEKETPPSLTEDGKNSNEEEEEEDDIEALLIRPDGTVPLALWVLCVPVYACLYYGMPKPTERSFMPTFVISLVWIGLFSFFLVYCVEVLGEVLNIPIEIMGVTLLAAGTSIPDLVSSMAVARAGEGDMAVSSSIGSNIFDILVGLPIPWVIKIVFIEMIAKGTSGFAVNILSEYIVLYVLILVLMVFLVVATIHFLGWILDRAVGIGMALLYGLFLIIVLTVEFSEPEFLKF